MTSYTYGATVDSAQRRYVDVENGCLPCTTEDLARDGYKTVRLAPHDDAAGSSASSSLRLGMGAVSVRAAASATASGDTGSFEIPTMSPAKDQRDLPSCTVFAIVAALEALVPDKRFSEAELWLRMATWGGKGRADRGTYLHAYIPLLKEGMVEEDSFIPYDIYNAYVEWRRKQASESAVLAESDSFMESIDALKRWCVEYKKAIPADSALRPVWQKKRLPSRFYGMRECTVRTGYWRSMIFNSFLLHLDPKSSDFINNLKYILRRVPIVVSLGTFESRLGDKEPSWLEHCGKATSGIVYLPKEPACPAALKGSLFSLTKGGHALCLCGYNDSIGGGAFKFKNSYGADWGEKGFGWVTYNYVKGTGVTAEGITKRLLHNVMVIIPHPTESWTDVDMDDITDSYLRPHDKTTETFYRMLEEYTAHTERK